MFVYSVDLFFIFLVDYFVAYLGLLAPLVRLGSFILPRALIALLIRELSQIKVNTSKHLDGVYHCFTI